MAETARRCSEVFRYTLRLAPLDLLSLGCHAKWMIGHSNLFL